MSLFLRKARRKDRNGMKACNERNLQENYALSNWEKTLTDHPGCSYVVCDADNKISGYLMSNGSLIISFAVDKEIRQQKWGTKLLTEFLKDHALNTDVTLHVRESNQVAQMLYAKFGFLVIDELPNYYNNPQETGYLMKRPQGKVL